MMHKFINWTIRILGVSFLIGCQAVTPIVVTADDYHNAVDEVTQIMVHDIFSPPVASRVYVYPNICAYEIIAQNNPSYKSLAGQISKWKGIQNIPVPGNINYKLASLIAYIKMSKALIFSEQMINQYSDSIYSTWQNQNPKEFETATQYATKVVDSIKIWMGKDNYNQTRTMPKYSINPDDPSRWMPTPPSYMDAIEPHWNKIHTLVINSADQFKPEPPPVFSLKKNSPFYKELKEVYDISTKITTKGDDSESVAIAQFWDCNPYVSVTRGHMMFATKKITPGAHWIGICKIACKKTSSKIDKTIMAYTQTSIALFDGFISCWDEKYRSNLIRPETLINQHIDEGWKPILQTPPFPEYTSGHSVVSGAASVVLTHIFGDTFTFDDDTELPYGLPIRQFSSFYNASDEAAISRMYGGIHYRKAVEKGLLQGRTLGEYITKTLSLK